MPHFRVRVATAGVAAVLALAFAACGGSYSGGSSANSSAPPASSATAPGGSNAMASDPGIPQNNGGDHDADNNGGPSDGDGSI
jgi:hypothetical protein